MKREMEEVRNLMKSVQEFAAELELLKKSSVEEEEKEEKKKEDAKDDKKEELEKKWEPIMDSEGAGESAEASPESSMEGDKIEEQAAELDEMAEEGEETLEQILGSMDEENLHALASAVHAELEVRSASEEAEAPAEEVAPEAPAEVKPEVAAPEAVEKSKPIMVAAKKMMKAEQGLPPQKMAAKPAPMAKEQDEMKKSLQALMAQNEKLMKSQEALQTKVNELSRKSTYSRPAAMNSSSVKVETLEKSQQVPEMLAKSEVVDFLINEQRQGNARVNLNLVQDASRAHTPNDLRTIYATAEKLGVKIPNR